MAPKNKKFLFAAACLGMLLFGITITTLGSILPEIIVRFDISKTDAGSLFGFMNFGILIGSFVFGPVVDRFGYKALLSACAVLLFLGMEGVALSHTFELFLISIFLFGFSGGVINGATNALVSDISGEGRGSGLALLGVFFGMGAFGVPLILGFLLNFFTYTQIVASLGSIIVLAFFVFLLLEFPAPKQPHSFPVSRAFSLLKEPTLLLLAFILFFQSGIEIMTGGWTAAYFFEELEIQSSTAVILLSFFWIGLMVARIIASKLLIARSPVRILLVSLAFAFAGVLLLLFTHHIIPATIAIFILGAGFGPVYPIILGFIGDLYPKISGTAFLVVLVYLISILILFLFVRNRFKKYHGRSIRP